MKISNLPPVLLTSCVYIADQAVNLKDPEERIKHTLESVAKWLELVPNIKLVICDNSGYDFTQDISSLFPSAEIECLAFITDKNLVQTHSKGYGEGEIIKHALTHSLTLSKTDFFAKCTAKLWVENFLNCIKEWNGSFLCNATFRNVFSFKKTRLDHIDTRFYLASKDFYLKYLVNAHLNLGGNTGLGIEESFLNIILANNLSGVLFNTPPLVGGVGGGTGKYYNIKRSKKIKEALRSKFVKLSPTFKHLFNHD